jgi:hypothetical protein
MSTSLPPKENTMNQSSHAAAVTTAHALITPAIADLERARPRSAPGDVVSLAGRDWQDRFIMTTRYGWLRLPD